MSDPPSGPNRAPDARAPVVIFGGGVGLWLLRHLRARGCDALLLESDALGSGQTIWSQGIIHGGMKYALTGEMTRAARAIAEMPGRWRDCIEGRGELDLTATDVLSPCQYLWTGRGVVGRLGAFAASRVLRAAPRPVERADRPEALRDAPDACRIYRMDEPIVSTPTLLANLVDPVRDATLRIDWPDGVDFEPGEDGRIDVIRLTRPDGSTFRLGAGCIVLTAGAGNESICSRLGIDAMPMQRRPLHQVLARGPLPPLYGHCIAALSDKPRLTITSHPAADGETVWNIGGDIAERGVDRDADAQRSAARADLEASLPWIDFGSVRFSTEMIDRAEPKQDGGRRPDTPWARRERNVIVAWPTKLAFAPKLAEEVDDLLDHAALGPARDPDALDDWPRPAVAAAPWDENNRVWN
jgi:glycerol-3-phosphate dehydrogenase